VLLFIDSRLPVPAVVSVSWDASPDDTSGFLANWLHDLSEEQLKDSDGVVPLVVPDTLSAFGGGPLAQAVWVRN